MPAGAPQHAVEPEKRLLTRLRVLLTTAADAQRGRAFLWCPVALAAGIAIYFALAQEPRLALAAAGGAAGFLLLWRGRAAPVLMLAGLVALGFALAKVRADWVASPLLAATTAEVAVTGRVAHVERASARRMVVILEPHAVEGIARERLPRRLRLSLPEKAGRPPLGAAISLKAFLAPLPAPVMPGGFDYGRRLWFEGVGGTGRVTSQIKVLDGAAAPGDVVADKLAELRALMGARIHAALDQPYASFAEALITGERSAIPPEINRSLLVSGLFHILSISGLHMWLVAGGVFWGVRAALALVPALALRRPIKKWAAASGLAAGLFYLLLADSGVATARAFIMVAVVFFAVMVDRPALSTRNLAIAALIVLVVEPEAAVEAGFQMSFLAVLGLVAFYEAWARFRGRRAEQPAAPRHWSLRLLLWAGGALCVSLLTSLIAGAASSVPAAYHFGRLSPYGVLANGLAIPVVGLIVMPAALLAVVLMPLGLEALPLALLEQGLKVVIAISDAIAALPGANAVAPRAPAMVMLLLGAGVIAASLLAGPLRVAGLALVAAGAAAGLLRPEPFPDILVDRTGSNAAIRTAEGLLVPAHSRRARFSVEKWLAANGEEEGPGEAARRPGWACAASRCEARVKGRRVVYLSRWQEGRAPDCTGADILIADFPLRRFCRDVPLRIDRFDLWRSGAHAVFIDGGVLRVETARAAQGDRPWVVRPERHSTPFTARSPQDDRPLD